MGLESSTGLLRECVQRSLDGPVMREVDFDLKLSQQVRLVTSEYALRFNPEEIICDDHTADAIWEAALELVERVGMYNFDTNRVVLLGRKEVEAAARRVSKEFVRGEGKDAVTIPARAHDSKVPPVIVPLPGRSTRFKTGLASVLIDMLNAYSSDTGPLGELARELKGELDGIPHLAKTPGEIIWGRAQVRWQRAIAERMGKPGLWLSGVEEISPAAIVFCHRHYTVVLTGATTHIQCKQASQA